MADAVPLNPMPRPSRTNRQDAASSEVVISEPATVQEPSPPEGGVRFLRPYGFQDEYGDAWFWHPGALVRNPYVLSLLASRGAPTEPLE